MAPLPWMKEQASELFDAALAAYARGWAVIPIRPRSKQPLVRWVPYQQRRPREIELRAWWRRWPKANLGIVCGGISGLMVLDLETGVKLDAANPMPISPTVVTGTGGRHYYLKLAECVEAPSVNLRGCGIQGELKGEGTYVVAPPSVHPSGVPYEWAIRPEDEPLAPPPAWVLKLMHQKLEEKRHTSSCSVEIPEQAGSPIDVEELPIPHKWREIIKTGAVPERYRNPDGSPDRSRRDEALICVLLSHGVGERDIFRVFRQQPVGKKYREHPDGDRYLAYSIARAEVYLRTTSQGSDAEKADR